MPISGWLAERARALFSPMVKSVSYTHLDVYKRQVDDLAEEIAEIVHDGVQLAVVVGGGNIFRGLAGSAEGMDRSQACLLYTSRCV